MPKKKANASENSKIYYILDDKHKALVEIYSIGGLFLYNYSALETLWEIHELQGQP